jgi:hypothetical protein
MYIAATNPIEILQHRKTSLESQIKNADRSIQMHAKELADAYEVKIECFAFIKELDKAILQLQEQSK